MKAVHSPITNWPKNGQPREKLRIHGAAALSDAELLAIFLRVGVKGKSAVALAKDLLHHFGSLPRLLGCSRAELTRIHGMGLSKWSQIQAAYELVKRSLEDVVLPKIPSFARPATLKSSYRPKLAACRMRSSSASTLTQGSI